MNSPGEFIDYQETMLWHFAFFVRGSIYPEIFHNTSPEFTCSQEISTFRCLLTPEVLKEIDRLLNDYTDREVAEILNQNGFLSGSKKKFDGRRVQKTRRAYQLQTTSPFKTGIRRQGQPLPVCISEAFLGILMMRYPKIWWKTRKSFRAINARLFRPILEKLIFDRLG